MSNHDYLNLSTDLRRISLWLQEGRVELAESFIKKTMDKFGNDTKKIGNKTIAEWLSRISVHSVEKGSRPSEDALTLSVLLKNRFILGQI